MVDEGGGSISWVPGNNYSDEDDNDDDDEAGDDSGKESSSCNPPPPPPRPPSSTRSQLRGIDAQSLVRKIRGMYKWPERKIREKVDVKIKKKK